jgi:hypothetical protein
MSMKEDPEYLADRSRLMLRFAFMALDCEAAIETAEEWNSHRPAGTPPRDFESDRVIRHLAWRIHDLALNHLCIPPDLFHRIETACENRQLSSDPCV